MKTVVILGAGSMGMAAAELLNPREMKLVGMGDTRPEAWNVFASRETGEFKDAVEGMPVMPVDLAVAMQPDVLVIAAADEETSSALRYMAIRAGFSNDILFLHELSQAFSVSCSVLRRLCRRLDQLNIPGNAAELGCYRGDTSWQLNALMPERKLYLFDTFEGFDPRDIAAEIQLGCSAAQAGQFSGASAEKLMARMPNADQVILKKGWFPQTALDMEEETFALVYMDACLYRPTLSGLEFFFPRMSRGGVILLKSCEDGQYGGVQQAVADLEEKYGALLLLPAGDLTGTVMIVHP